MVTQTGMIFLIGLRLNGWAWKRVKIKPVDVTEWFWVEAQKLGLVEAISRAIFARSIRDSSPSYCCCENGVLPKQLPYFPFWYDLAFLLCFVSMVIMALFSGSWPCSLSSQHPWPQLISTLPWSKLSQRMSVWGVLKTEKRYQMSLSEKL